MPSFLRLLLFLLVSPLALAATEPAPKGKPASATPPVAQLAWVNAVTFHTRSDGANHKLVVISSPTLLRVDEPDDRLSIIYDPANDHYTGLEHGNYTYWQFSWSEVRAAIETSKRYENRLRDLTSDNAASYQNQNPTNTNAATSSSVGGDTSAYLWHPTNDKKRVSDVDCVRWIGQSNGGDEISVWCTESSLPDLREAMERLRVINEPIALVPVRTLVPPFVFAVYDALIKGGVTPISITWGPADDKSEFTFIESKKREYKPSLFAIPSVYNRTTLVTMDGMIDQKK